MIASRARSAVRGRAARLAELSIDLARRGLNTAALSLRLLRARDPFNAGSNTVCTDFVSWLSREKGARVLEIGTRRTEGGAPTTRRHWAHPSAEYVTSDFMAGLDVDVVADAEKLSDAFGTDAFDAVIGCSVFEHIRRPWLAAAEIGKVLRPGARHSSRRISPSRSTPTLTIIGASRARPLKRSSGRRQASKAARAIMNSLPRS